MLRHWELRDRDNMFFAVGPTELEAWLNLLRLKGKCFTMDYFMMMVKSMKCEGNMQSKEILEGE